MDKPEERVSILEPVIARTHTTFYDKQNGLWRHNKLAQRSRKQDPINPTNYDPWVYHYTKENIGPHVQWHDREKGGDAPV